MTASGPFKLEHVSGARLADMLAQLEVALPRGVGLTEVQEQWTYRFLAAAVAEAPAQSDG